MWSQELYKSTLEGNVTGQEVSKVACVNCSNFEFPNASWPAFSAQLMNRVDHLLGLVPAFDEHAVHNMARGFRQIHDTGQHN
jgi:hypothetical protein